MIRYEFPGCCQVGHSLGFTASKPFLVMLYLKALDFLLFLPIDLTMTLVCNPQSSSFSLKITKSLDLFEIPVYYERLGLLGPLAQLVRAADS